MTATQTCPMRRALRQGWNLRQCLPAIISAAALAFIAQAKAQSDSFPSHAITIVAPTAPGSTTDLLARLVAPLLSRSLGVAVVVDNKVGAASNIGAAAVAQAKPDGYTLLLAPPPPLAINQWLYKKLAFNPEKDFSPIVALAATPNVLVVHPSVAATNLAELIALAKAKPGEITYASGGNGTSHHLCGELLKQSAQVSLTHVPYKSPAPALQDVLAGRVSMMCENLSNALVHVRSGGLRAIALTAATRHRQAPEIPTAHESGLPGFAVGAWFGMVAPAGTPPAIINRLNTELTAAMRDATVAQRIQAAGLTSLMDSPESFGQFIAAESTKWRAVVVASGAQID